MNRLDQVFENKSGNILNVYFTAGYPKLDDTTRILKALETAGADLVEIGMPYSDPMADGPTIQQSNDVALANGMTLQTLFDQLAGIREHVSVPIVLMGYVNPVMQYGLERFCEQCAKVGVDGVILPDLPMAEYLSEHKAVFEKHGLYNVFLITPNTSEARIREIDENTHGFIYMVSSASITGAKGEITTDQVAYFERVNAMGLRNPRLIGFGISNHETFSKACQYAKGAIIGSAFINLVRESQDLEKDITEYIHAVKGA